MSGIKLIDGKREDFDASDQTVTDLSCGSYACFRRGKAEGEQLFTLRAHDASTPRTIAFWIMENIETCGEDKLRHALEDALRARKWPNRHRAD